MPLVFDGINRAEKKMSESSCTATNNNQSKSLATANHRNTMTSTDNIVATTITKQSKSTRQYKSKNKDKDIAVDSMSKDSTSKSASSSSTNTTTTNCNTATSSPTSSMARSNRRQSIHRSVKSTKQTTSVPSTVASTSNTSTNSTSSTLQTTTLSNQQQQQEQYQENDTFLSLSNPTYKSVLYTLFQQMNNNDTREEEKRMATKIINIFKKNGGRFYKKSGRGNVQKEMNFVQVDEDAALRKIQDDIRRRKENAQHWQHQQTLTAPSEEDIPSSPSIPTSQTKTDKKKKSSKKSIPIVRREGAKLGWESRKKKSDQSNDDEAEEIAVDEDGSSISSTDMEDRPTRNSVGLSGNTNDDSTAEMSGEEKKKSSTATVVKKEVKKRESKARTVKLSHPHASDAKAQPSTAVIKTEKKKSKTPVKKTKKSIKARAGSSRQQRQTTTTIRAARPSEKKQADAQQATKSNGMTEWQCFKCSKKFAWKSPQCAGACISNHMRKSHGITLPTMKELSQKKKEKKSIVVKSSSTRRVVGGASRPSRSSTSVRTSAASTATGANQQPKQQEKTKKRGRELSAKKASVTFDSDIQSYLGEEPFKKKKRKSDTTTSSRSGQKKNSVKGNTPSKAVSSKSKRAAPSRRQSTKTTNHVTPSSVQKTKSLDSTSSLVVIESAASSSSTKKSGTNKLNFAQKLHAMIMDADENHPDTLCWNEEGDSFIVKERDTPLQPLLSRYFRTTKYTSLYRSLANYGFVADYTKIQEKDVVCFMREDFTRDSTPTALACFAKDKSTTAEKIVSIKEEESTASRRSVPKRKAFTNACGVIQGAMTEEDNDTSPTKEEEGEDVEAFEVGQRIEARYRGQGRRWYKGTIVASLGNGLYDIDYDDGDSDRSLSSDAIRVRMPRRKKMSKKQQQMSAEQPHIGKDDDMMMNDTFNNNTRQQTAPLLNERQRIIFDLGSGREDENDDSFDKENSNKAGVSLFSPIKAKRVTFTEDKGVAGREENTCVEVLNDSSFSPIKPFNQVKSKDTKTSPIQETEAKGTTQTLSSPTQVFISSKSQAVKREQMMQPLTLVKVGVIDNEVVMPLSKDDDSSLEQDTTDTFQGILSPESDSNTPSSKDPGDDLFQFNWDGRATSTDDFLADEIGYDLFSTNKMTSSRRGTYASGRGGMYTSYPSGHGKARTSSSWDKIRL